MRGLRKALGAGLILVGSSGLALTAIVLQEPGVTEAPEDGDPLEPATPSTDAWAMGLAFAGVTATGAWVYRTSRG